MTLGFPQVGLTGQQPPPLQEEAGQLALVPRRERVALEPVTVEREVQLEHVGLAQGRSARRRLGRAGDCASGGERRGQHEQPADCAVYR